MMLHVTFNVQEILALLPGPVRRRTFQMPVSQQRSAPKPGWV